MRTQLSKTQSLIMNSQILAQRGTIPAAVVVQDSSPIQQGPQFCLKPEDEKKGKGKGNLSSMAGESFLPQKGKFTCHLVDDNILIHSRLPGIGCFMWPVVLVLYLKSGHLLCPLGSATSLLLGIAQGRLQQLREKGRWNHGFINYNTCLHSRFWGYMKDKDFFVSSI